MHSILSTCIDYLQFYISSYSAAGHGIHSPFVYQFARSVLGDTRLHPAYLTWAPWRKELLADATVLPIVEHGAGSATAPGRSERSVGDLARQVSKPERTARLLFRIAQFYQPGCIVELGTSLGLSTAFFSLACPSATIFTIEGNPAVADKARSHFDRWGLRNVEQITGHFDAELPASLNKVKQVDLAFLDGNHQLEPTLRYFEWLLSAKTPGSVFIIDDIYWSQEMKMAWETIKQHPEVRCTIDLFQFGLVFFKEEFKEVRHFSIRF